MLGDSFVLVIENDPTERAYLDQLFPFIGKGVISTDTSQALSILETQLAEQSKLLCVVIGQVQRSQYLPLISAIDQCNSHLPIILLQPVKTVHWPLNMRHRILQQLSQPLNYHSLVDALHRAYVYSDIYRPLSIGNPKLFSSLVGTSTAISQLREQVQQLPDSDSALLISGEVGSGKEILARNIHAQSLRRQKPFVVLDCSAVSAEILPAVLLGYAKGAHEGALVTQLGYLELAEGGSLFLDQASALTSELQQQLVTIIQQQSFQRLGDSQLRHCNVRLILADHNDLAKQLIPSLYQLVQPHVFSMPALRQRLEDVPLLMHQLLLRLEKNKRGSIRFNSGAIMALCHYSWPGNVRELANLVERMAMLHPYGVIGLRELPEQYRGEKELATNAQDKMHEDSGLLLHPMNQEPRLPAEGLDLRRYLSNLEQDLIEQALLRSAGVVAHAAELLGMGRTTLVEKMRKYHIARKDT